MKSVEDKFRTVIQKNTFYFFNKKFEEDYEGYINSLKETLLVVKNKVETEGLKKDIFEWLLKEKENGLRALLALTGFSNEYLKRLTTILRIVDNPELNTLVFKDKWHSEKNPDNIQEWSDGTILKKIQSNEYFRKGLVNIFFEGASIPFLANTIPLFELKKLSISKLNFEIPELIDTIIRYKEKGSYSGMKGNNPETVIADILEKLGLTYETGDLTELISNAPDNKRTMDFIIPNKKNPLIIAESSFLATTSSGQGDKSKTEISIDALIKEHYPNATFVGFVDGIGWYVRKSDLKRMVTAYEDVFTFHKDELQRFEKLLIETFKK
ncbi:DpnII family type II restriction endonuclease [Tannerella forsythia]|uniref:DpnII family type II restriction endonuclease n=1 Tax=Tannerella forsythia TaxID=28112 RepID=UPI0028EA3151|nr:DpnII family type II restriction endonuclease [Tannerella forsythia]